MNDEEQSPVAESRVLFWAVDLEVPHSALGFAGARLLPPYIWPYALLILSNTIDPVLTRIPGPVRSLDPVPTLIPGLVRRA